MVESILDEPGLVVRRCLLELVYHKLVANLHWKYFIVGRTNTQYIYSRQARLEAVLSLLQMQNSLDRETQPGGRFSKVGLVYSFHPLLSHRNRLLTILPHLQDRWNLTSPLIQGELLLATIILCLDVTHDLKLESLHNQESLTNSEPPGVDRAMRARSLSALTICSRIWASLVDTSEAAAKASSVVRFVPARAVPNAAAQAPRFQDLQQQQPHKSIGQSVPQLFDNAAYSMCTNANLAGIVGSVAGLADVQPEDFDMVRTLVLPHHYHQKVLAAVY